MAREKDIYFKHAFEQTYDMWSDLSDQAIESVEGVCISEKFGSYRTIKIDMRYNAHKAIRQLKKLAKLVPPPNKASARSLSPPAQFNKRYSDTVGKIKTGKCPICEEEMQECFTDISQDNIPTAVNLIGYSCHYCYRPKSAPAESNKNLIKALKPFMSKHMEQLSEDQPDEAIVRLEISECNGYSLQLTLKELRTLWMAYNHSAS